MRGWPLSSWIPRNGTTTATSDIDHVVLIPHQLLPPLEVMANSRQAGSRSISIRGVSSNEGRSVTGWLQRDGARLTTTQPADRCNSTQLNDSQPQAQQKPFGRSEGWTCGFCGRNHGPASGDALFLACALCGTARDAYSISASERNPSMELTVDTAAFGASVSATWGTHGDDIVREQDCKRPRPAEEAVGPAHRASAATTTTFAEGQSAVRNLLASSLLREARRPANAGEDAGLPASATPASSVTPSSRRSITDVLLKLPADPAIVDGVRVTDTALAASVPAQLCRAALPRDLAERLLRDLLVESAAHWTSHEWTVYGARHTTPRTTALYDLTQGSDASVRADSDVEHAGLSWIEPPASLLEAASVVATLVAKRCPSARPWRPTLALANRYDDGDQCIGYHSDFINRIGPRPIIAGLSLGATRRMWLEQRVQRSAGTEDKSMPLLSTGDGCHSRDKQLGNTDDGTAGIAPIQRRRKAIIPMPHNSVVVMMADAQESWRHAVPRMADGSIRRHPSAGLCRLSLTFRMTRGEVAVHTPRCACGNLAALKSTGPVGYHYMCDPTKPEGPCTFFQRGHWAEEEAIATRIVELVATRPEHGVSPQDVMLQVLASSNRSTLVDSGPTEAGLAAMVLRQGAALWRQGLVQAVSEDTGEQVDPTMLPVPAAVNGNGNVAAPAIRYRLPVPS